MREKLSNCWGYIVYSLIFLVLPAIIGIIFYFTIHSAVQLEAAFVIFGAFSILIGLFRTRRHDTKNFRKNKTLHEDKDTEEYKGFAVGQWFFYVTGIVDLLISLLMFFFVK